MNKISKKNTKSHKEVKTNNSSKQEGKESEKIATNKISIKGNEKKNMKRKFCAVTVEEKKKPKYKLGLYN